MQRLLAPAHRLLLLAALLVGAGPVGAQQLTIYHMNDVHARLTPHPWVISNHGIGPDNFETVGGAAYLAGELLSLVGSNPTALVLDGGDISEGNPIGDMNCTTPSGGGAPVCVNSGYGNGGLTSVYSLMHAKLAAIGGARGARGIDALVVGNHDVRDISYITNMEHMRDAGVPVISVNVRDIATHQPHFSPTTTVVVNGVKVGIIGYTTSSATVGATLASTLEVVDCQWTGSATCNISTYVNDLRNNQGCAIVILLTHDGHSDLVDPTSPVLADTSAAVVPEIAITGHWHTWASSVWQPTALHYKTMFAESSSYMNYVGELNVTSTGKYVSAVQHVLRNADITPDPDVQALVNGMITQFNAARPGHPVDEVIGYSNDDLLLDNKMKWWSADEYPWSGNNSAGQWITDAMQWKCGQIAWPSGGGCDLAIEAGGGVRADIPAGPVTYLETYETFPWADDTYVRVTMTGQDIINFINSTNLDTGFSRALDVTATDGIITSVLMNGQPIGLSTSYKVAINNYMLAHPPAKYTWPTTIAAESDPAATLVRDSLVDYMRQVHSTPATAYSVGGPRYHLNGEYSGGYRAVVTMMNDADSALVYDDAFIRFISALPETTGRRGSRQVPAALVNADGSIVAGNRLAEQELYRSYLGFRTGALVPGDIVEVQGKASFYGGNPEFVDQEGVYGAGVEFKIVGHDASLAKPIFVSSIGDLLGDNYKNHYVKFLAQKTSASTVVDQNGTSITIWDRTAYTKASLPGSVGNTLVITGVPTMESFATRFRSDSAAVSTTVLPASAPVTSQVTPLGATTSGPVTLTATAAVGTRAYSLAPLADAETASGNPNTNYGKTTNIFIQSSTATGTFGIERVLLKFDLSTLPAGITISKATLGLWNWKSTGPSLAVDAHAVANDAWTETGLTWNNQPAAGAVLDTQTLASGKVNAWYYWDVTSFVQSEAAGDKVASLMLSAANEALGGGPSYAFDTREYGTNTPVLTVTTQTPSAAVSSLTYYYRYSSDNTNWTPWTATGGAQTSAPYSTSFGFPNGLGYYEFYSSATDNQGNTQAAPAYAMASVVYQAPSGSAQSIAFGGLASSPVASTISLAATATSGLPVVFTSLTPAICSVSGGQLLTAAIGQCVVEADQAGSVGYWLAAAAVTQGLTVTGLPQSIQFTAPGDLTIGASTALVASATSLLPVSFSSLTPLVCSVSANSVTALAVGSCTVSASQPGDGAYWLAATPVSQTLAVAGLPQTISFPAIADRVLDASPFTVTLSSTSGLPVSLASQTASVCSVSGTAVTLISTGTCALIATAPASGSYAAADPVARSFAVTAAATGGAGNGSSTDGPLPAWATALFGFALVGGARRRLRRRT